MADHSAIEWTDATWNPVTGCSKVSPGCAHCYAERLAPKLFAGQATRDPVTVVERRRVFTDVRCHADRLEHPLHWKKPRRVFVNSVSDLFHEDVPAEFIADVFAMMHATPQHTYQVLTKRPARMLNLFRDPPADITTPWPLPNVWLGVSVENQHFADERIPLLLQTPAAVRFISAEPLLGPVDLTNLTTATTRVGWIDALRCRIPHHLDWVIVGGESGPGARPMHPDWARSIRDQCVAAGVAFFFKQWGEWVDPMDDDRWGGWDDVVMNERGHQCADGPLLWHVGKKIAGRRLDGREWNDYPLPRGTSQTSEKSQT